MIGLLVLFDTKSTMATPDTQSVEDMLKAVNDSAGSARALFVTLMLLSLYFVIVVAGTDDVALLRNATVAVPTLSNATLPAVAFYACASIVYVFLHLDLLIHFKLLSDKLRHFNFLLDSPPVLSSEARTFRLRLTAFPFSTWLGSDPASGRLAHALQGVIVWLTLVVLPLGVLFALQLGFLAYQSVGITNLHRGAIVVDIALLLYFWPRLLMGRAAVPRAGFAWGRRAVLLGAVVVLASAWLVHAVAAVAFSVIAVLGGVVMLVGVVAAVAGLVSTAFAALGSSAGPKSRRSLWPAMKRACARVYCACWSVWPVAVPSVVLLGFSFLVATIPQERWEQWAHVVMKPLDHASFQRQITQFAARECEAVEDPAALSLACSRFQTDFQLGGGGDRSDATPSAWGPFACVDAIAWSLPGVPFPGSLTTSKDRQSALARFLEDANTLPQGLQATCATIALFHIKGTLLRRTLTVNDRVMARSDVKPELARDLGVNLRRWGRCSRKVSGEACEAESLTDFEDLSSQIQGLDLTERSLLWANFKGIRLPGARLKRARLDHALLDNADLRHVDLAQASLVDSRLNQASLMGANLNDASLVHATLSEASLSGATLIGARMTGASFAGATMQGAFLAVAQLDGANFWNADLTAANLTRSELRGTTLRGAVLIGATLDDTALTGTDLSGAVLTAATLRGARVARVSWPAASRMQWLLVGRAMGSQDVVGEEVAQALRDLRALPEKDRNSHAVRQAIGRLERPTDGESTPSGECIGAPERCPGPSTMAQRAEQRATHLKRLVCNVHSAHGAFAAMNLVQSLARDMGMRFGGFEADNAGNWDGDLRQAATLSLSGIQRDDCITSGKARDLANGVLSRSAAQAAQGRQTDLPPIR